MSVVCEVRGSNRGLRDDESRESPLGQRGSGRAIRNTEYLREEVARRFLAAENVDLFFLCRALFDFVSLHLVRESCGRVSGCAGSVFSRAFFVKTAWFVVFVRRVLFFPLCMGRCVLFLVFRCGHVRRE